MNTRTVSAFGDDEEDIKLFAKIELKEAFALFDRVGSGVIRTKDLGHVMRSIGYQASPSELEQMIREVDQDGLLE